MDPIVSCVNVEGAAADQDHACGFGILFIRRSLDPLISGDQVKCSAGEIYGAVCCDGVACRIYVDGSGGYGYCTCDSALDTVLAVLCIDVQSAGSLNGGR